MEKTVCIVAHWNRYNKDFNYNIQNYTPSESSGDILIEERTLHFETLTEKELQMRLVAAKRAALQKLRGEHFVEEKEAEEEIQELLALEDKLQEHVIAKAEDDVPF